jgi:cell division protein FtsQ
LRVVGLVACGTAFIYLAHSGMHKLLDPATLPYRSVTIEGSFEHVDADAIRATVAPYLSAGFFGVNVSDVQHALATRPWVSTATVRRVWPDEIRVRVYEQVPVARWGDDGLVNTTDKLFFPVDRGKVDALPRVYGPLHSEAFVMESYRTMNNMLKPFDLMITDVVLDERRAWHLTLNNNLKLALGRDNAMDRLQRFVRFYPTVLAGKSQEIEEIDLRYTNGFVVRWNLPNDKVLNSGMG